MPAAPVRDQTGAAVLFLCLNSFDKAKPLVIPAELAHWVDDYVHLPQFHAVHQTVELVEVLLYLLLLSYGLLSLWHS